MKDFRKFNLNEDNSRRNLNKNGVLHNVIQLGCGCNSPYPRWLPAKEVTKCMNCRKEY